MGWGGVVCALLNPSLQPLPLPGPLRWSCSVSFVKTPWPCVHGHLWAPPAIPPNKHRPLAPSGSCKPSTLGLPEHFAPGAPLRLFRSGGGKSSAPLFGDPPSLPPKPRKQRCLIYQTMPQDVVYMHADVAQRQQTMNIISLFAAPP